MVPVLTPMMAVSSLIDRSVVFMLSPWFVKLTHHTPQRLVWELGRCMQLQAVVCYRRSSSRGSEQLSVHLA
jgi:hypothetical protein